MEETFWTTEASRAPGVMRGKWEGELVSRRGRDGIYHQEGKTNGIICVWIMKKHKEEDERKQIRKRRMCVKLC